MTDNEKLARWQGARDCRGSKNNKSKWKWPTSYDPNLFYYKALPNYLSDDAAAMSLLDTLVEKVYEYELQAHYCYNAERVMYRLKLECIKTGDVLWADGKNYFTTRREAVVAAVLELIEKEANSGGT